jgi:hypothetical protein
MRRKPFQDRHSQVKSSRNGEIMRVNLSNWFEDRKAADFTYKNLQTYKSKRFIIFDGTRDEPALIG